MELIDLFIELFDFLKATILFNDDSKIESRLHKLFVEKKKYLNEDQWNEICAKTKFSLGSYKLNYALNIGLARHGNLGGALYTSVSLFSLLFLYYALYYILKSYLNSEIINVLINALYPVLSAYFVYRSYGLLRDTYRQFALAIYIAYIALSFLLIFVLELRVTLVLIVSLFLFLCFTRGGKHNE